MKIKHVADSKPKYISGVTIFLRRLANKTCTLFIRRRKTYNYISTLVCHRYVGLFINYQIFRAWQCVRMRTRMFQAVCLLQAFKRRAIPGLRVSQGGGGCVPLAVCLFRSPQRCCLFLIWSVGFVPIPILQNTLCPLGEASTITRQIRWLGRGWSNRHFPELRIC